MAKDDLTQERLKELVDYDPQTGLFVTKRSYRLPDRQVNVGDKAGSLGTNGYWLIVLDKYLYKAHRLAWLYMTGQWPKLHIDHIDGNPLNNKFDNLRDVTRFVNLQNRSKARAGNRTGLIGATHHKGRFRAKIIFNGKEHWIGYFKTAEEAHSAYLQAKHRLQGEI